MRILLVNPPNCGRSIAEEQYGMEPLRTILKGEPLSLEALAGNLDGHDVRIADLKAERETMGDVLSGFHPDIVGITGATCEANTMVKLAGEARSAGALTVVGGVHVSNDPLFFNREEVDFVVIGLGKLSFRELVDTVESGLPTDRIPGVGKTRPGKDLTILPRVYSKRDLVEERPPRYDLVASYRDHYTLKSFGFGLGLVSSAFGCPHRCSFCSIEPMTGGHYLTHDADTIVRDISLVGEMPVIRLVDANTFGNVAQAAVLCRRIMETGIKRNFIADVRSDTVVDHPDLFREWKEAGLRSVIIGFEEIDDARLGAMKKTNTTAVNTRAIEILHDMGITIVGDFIVSPDYDDEQFEALRRYLKEHPVDLPLVTVLTPLPGTALYESVKDTIIIDDLDYYTLTSAVTPIRMGEKAFYENYVDLMQARSNAKI